MSFEGGTSFSESRADNKSLGKIREETKDESNTLKGDISKDIMSKLHSPEGLEIKKGDTLWHMSRLTTKDNAFSFNDQAGKIWPGDKIKVLNGEVFRDSKFDGVDGMVKVGDVNIKGSDTVINETDDLLDDLDPVGDIVDTTSSVITDDVVIIESPDIVPANDIVIDHQLPVSETEVVRAIEAEENTGGHNQEEMVFSTGEGDVGSINMTVADSTIKNNDVVKDKLIFDEIMAGDFDDDFLNLVNPQLKHPIDKIGNLLYGKLKYPIIAVAMQGDKPLAIKCIVDSKDYFYNVETGVLRGEKTQ